MTMTLLWYNLRSPYCYHLCKSSSLLLAFLLLFWVRAPTRLCRNSLTDTHSSLETATVQASMVCAVTIPPDTYGSF